jgi:hypothetical protein
MKIYHYNRRTNGRFDSLKAMIRRGIQLAKIAFVAFVVLAATFTFGGLAFSTHTSLVEATEIVDLTPEKIEELKDDVIARLAKCESAGHKEDDGIIIFDSNNQASIGQLQWQIKSVQHYEKVLHDRSITRKEAVLLALDTERASALAEEVVFETEKGLSNWLNCANMLGLAAEVKVIKRLAD